MASSLLAPLAFLATAALAVGDAGKLSEFRDGCQSVLQGISSSGRSEMEVAMECRARLPPELCHTGLAELGAQPWSEDKIVAACDTITHDIEHSIESLPRDLQDQAYAEMNAQVEQCLQAKQKLAANPIKGKDGKPITINLKGLVVEVTLIMKILQSFKITDIMNKYYTCQKEHCTPTTTPKPVDPLSIFFAAAKSEAAKKSSPLHWPPSKKFEEGELGGAVQQDMSSPALGWLSLAMGGSTMVALAAFAANRLRRSARAMSVPDDSVRRLPFNDDDVEEHE